ncbi:transglycosylase SLT domain-containing protein [Methylotuvimicrobium alcaliphilum]|uniref:Lytic transglycosylase catalytic n=1 Tax=Methylotuvimicrobium alcaliphilum (strain DSM 19304 / NCIMB 14124 / VKM B-2133 / 20Z) TaxID=1091494 RepID=G4T3J9_META2|nr:transglycosylase SLT domain-containing protein [Methylotuvimicrobium alcaliphilum]CCE23721.1 Lytic transglycosylase catalytic [Methylotuvimicrobium alcaliphilum 20Z]
MRKKIFFYVAFFLFSEVLSADIYKYVSPDGKVYYTDRPAHRFYKRIIRTRPSSYNWAVGRMKGNKQKYNDIIAQAASKHQVDEKLVHAVIQAESAYHAQAISSAGAVGLMQLMPETAKRYGVRDRTDPVQNINGGTRYLKDLLKMFNSNLTLAVAAYNAGEGAVKKYNNSIPPYPETRNYVKQVLALYHK